ATAASVMYTLACGSTTAGGIYGGGSTGSTTQTVTLTVTAASSYTATTLVSDTQTTGATQDPNLVNPWGLVFATGAPVWIANNGSQTSTLYDGHGTALPLVVNLANDQNGAAITGFNPSGIVAGDNDPNDFVVTESGTSGASSFIYSGEGGSIAGWSATVDLTHAIAMYTAQDGAIYKGLAIASNGGSTFLYATDFHNGKVDVFDAHFAKQSATSFPFSDPKLPANLSPFGIQAIANGAAGAVQIYIAYAQPDAQKEDNADGAGLGAIDVFDSSGNLLQQLVPMTASGVLNAPWGLALAPSDFGSLSGGLLVSNFGDGKINGFDPTTGRFLGTLQTGTGPFSQDGLWGIAFGNDATNQMVSPPASLNQPHNTLFYTAGPNDEANGVYGRIDPPAM
ncbi:MAG TPA: TIGR03118 family protein, partial [Steroidobacteraceae bacterium]|nr:TIGR03118 family protein [Steroidobacteraceae bacterium]